MTGNRATGSPGVPVQGGGLYSQYPVVLVRSRISGNTPDQCVGC